MSTWRTATRIPPPKRTAPSKKLNAIQGAPAKGAITTGQTAAARRAGGILVVHQLRLNIGRSFQHCFPPCKVGGQNNLFRRQADIRRQAFISNHNETSFTKTPLCDNWELPLVNQRGPPF